MPSRVRGVLIEGGLRFTGSKRVKVRLGEWARSHAPIPFQGSPQLPVWDQVVQMWKFYRERGYPGGLYLYREKRGIRKGRSLFLKKVEEGIRAKAVKQVSLVEAGRPARAVPAVVRDERAIVLEPATWLERWARDHQQQVAAAPPAQTQATHTDLWGPIEPVFPRLRGGR